MQPRKLKVAFQLFAYGGNGGTASIAPGIARWMAKVAVECERDERIEQFISMPPISDTPITMCRNRSVVDARRIGADVLVMIDSDNEIDPLVGHDPLAKPFFASSFDYLHEHYGRGPSVIGCPYLGPPPHPVFGGEENVYVFCWRSRQSPSPSDRDNYFLEQYTREEAAQMDGIQECAALPTGVVMFDMRAFDLTEPIGEQPHLVLNRFLDGKVSADEAIKLIREESWFYYDFDDKYRRRKSSTEDVTCTRDISLIGIQKLGYNPLMCNWSAWAGHWKPKLVLKPHVVTSDQVSERLAEAARKNTRADERLVHVDYQDGLKTGYPRSASEVQHGNGRADRIAPETCVDVPMPEDVDGDIETLVDSWKGHNSNHEDRKVLIALCRQAARDRHPEIVEVGTFIGETAVAICEALDDHCTVLAVDHFLGTETDTTRAIVRASGGRLEEAFMHNVADRCYRQILPIVMPSDEAAELFARAGKQFDLVYLDAGHSFAEVSGDIECWKPLVRRGGILCGHDYGEMFPEVEKAVRARLGEAVEVRGTTWFLVIEDDEPAGRQGERARAQAVQQ